jgi:hypothetical protein
MSTDALRQNDVSGSIEPKRSHRPPWYRERDGRPRINRRSLVAAKLSQYATPFERAAQAALPWTLRTFPGLHKGLVAIFADRVDYQTIAHWRSGRREPPDWAREVVADYLRSRAASMLEAADALNEVSKRAEGRGVAATRARKAKRVKAAREV